PAARRIVQCDAPKMTAIDARHAVMARKAGIEEGVLGTQEIQHAVVVAYLALEEELRFRRHRLTQAVVKFAEDVGIGLVPVDVAHGEPLFHEVVHPTPGLGTTEHPMDLGLEYGLVMQLAAYGQLHQLVVGKALPQKE